MAGADRQRLDHLPWRGVPQPGQPDSRLHLPGGHAVGGRLGRGSGEVEGLGGQPGLHESLDEVGGGFDALPGAPQPGRSARSATTMVMAAIAVKVRPPAIDFPAPVGRGKPGRPLAGETKVAGPASGRRIPGGGRPGPGVQSHRLEVGDSHANEKSARPS